MQKTRCSRVCAAGVLCAAGATLWSAGVASAQCATWAPVALSGGGAITHFATFDEDGAGPLPPSLFAGGGFSTLGGVPALRVARWREGAWSAVGTNVAGGGVSSGVNGMVVFDNDGPGPHVPALYVGAPGITSADGTAVSGVARWDGAAWSAVGALQATPADVRCLFVYDADGTGPGLPVLIASGGFSSIGNVPAAGVASWDGVAWTAMDSGAPAGGFLCMAVFDDGGGGEPAALFAGSLDPAPTSALYRWSGGAWAPAAAQPFEGPSARVRHLVAHDEDGSGPAPNMLYCARLGAQGADCIRARAPGATWVNAGPSFPGETMNVMGLGAFDPDGDGPVRSRLIAGISPSFDAPGILQFDGIGWSLPAGLPVTGLSPLPSARAITTFNDGSGTSGVSRGALFIGLSSSINTPGHLLDDAVVLRLRTDPTAVDLVAPASITVPVGGTANFSTSGTYGSPPESVGWRRNGTPLVPSGSISGVYSGSLTISPVSASDQGIYECVITTGCGYGVTRPAMLVVGAPPDTCPVDTNGDQTIDFLDLNSILVFFGQPCP